MENSPRQLPWVRNLVMLWISQILVMAGFEAMIPFIPLFIKGHLGITDPGQLAMAAAMFHFWGSLGYTIFCPIWGKLGDRFGIKPMLLRGTFVTAFLFPLMAYSKSVAMLVFLRFVTASCAGTTAASQIMVARTTPEDRQGFAQGVLTTAIWGGAVLGSTLGGLIIHYFSFKHAFYFCGIAYFLAGFAIIPTVDLPTSRHKEKGASSDPAVSANQLPKPAAHPWWKPSLSFSVLLIMGLFFLLGIFRNMEIPFIALKIEQITGPQAAAYWTGIVGTIVCVGAVLSGCLIGHLADRMSSIKLIIPLFLLSAAALFMQGFAKSVLIFTIGRFMLYFFSGGLQPILQKLLSSACVPQERGTAFGLSTSLAALGKMASTLLGGGVVYYLQVSGVFHVTAISFLVCLPLFYFAIRKTTARP